MYVLDESSISNVIKILWTIGIKWLYSNMKKQSKFNDTNL